MTVRRVMGIETEYGIAMPGNPVANPMVMSGQVVTAYAQSQGIRPSRVLWDYTDEAPLRDARGFEMPRDAADASQLTDEDPTMANVVLTNGARYYVDHAHPEYSSPEVTSPLAAVRYDRAGDAIAAASVALTAQWPPALAMYKNNTDGKGATYGSHENYLLRRSTPFSRVVTGLTPFLVVRQVMCGAGRVGIGAASAQPGFQIAQRSDFFETEVGLETTLKRPIINTRDEPHAVADRYRRLHVIIGDANHADVANLLKLGTTSLVLHLIEAGAMPDTLGVRNPVGTLHEISHDPTLRTRLEMTDGRRMTALELLREIQQTCVEFVQTRYGGDVDSDTAQVLHWWERVLDSLETDPMSAHRYLDWVAKLRVLEQYRDRDALQWDSPRLGAIDLQWSDVRPDKGIFARLRAAGRVTELVRADEVEQAVSEPPSDTRAWFRGECIRRYRDQVVAASWDSLIFDVGGTAPLRRLPMLEPTRGTRDGVGQILDASPDALTLLERLAAPEGDTGIQ